MFFVRLRTIPPISKREPKKNHGACYGAEEKDLFGMMYSKGATEDFYVSHGEAILHRYINPESCSRNYQYKSDDDHGFLSDHWVHKGDL